MLKMERAFLYAEKSKEMNRQWQKREQVVTEVVEETVRDSPSTSRV